MAAQLHLHEPLPGARTVAMNRARHELLADAALAEQHHGGVGRRRALHRFEHRAQRRALADDLAFRLHRELQLAVLRPQLATASRRVLAA